MLSINDVARIFEVPPDTVRLWWEQGKIRAYDVSPQGALNFLQEDVAIAYIDRSIRICLGC